MATRLEGKRPRGPWPMAPLIYPVYLLGEPPWNESGAQLMKGGSPINNRGMDQNEAFSLQVLMEVLPCTSSHQLGFG